MRLIRGRLAGVSVRASFLAGMWVGLTAGLVIGAILGAALVWFAGTVLEWQRDLAFTLGVARTLLPLGDQVGALRWISSTWFLVIPAVAVGVALITALFVGLIGALLAAAYNRSPRHADVVVELPDPDAATAEAVADATSRRPRGGTRRGRGDGLRETPRTPPSEG